MGCKIPIGPTGDIAEIARLDGVNLCHLGGQGADNEPGVSQGMPAVDCLHRIEGYRGHLHMLAHKYAVQVVLPAQRHRFGYCLFTVDGADVLGATCIPGD